MFLSTIHFSLQHQGPSSDQFYGCSKISLGTKDTYSGILGFRENLVYHNPCDEYQILKSMFLKQINFVDQNLIIITGISPTSTIQYYWYCERKSYLFMCCYESKCCAVEIYSFLNLKSSCLLNLLKMFLVCTNKESLFYEIKLININEPISNIVSVVFEVHIQCNSEYNSIQYSVVLIWICNLDDYESCSPVINAPDSPDQKNQTGWRLLVNISKLWSSMKNKEDRSIRQ